MPVKWMVRVALPAGTGAAKVKVACCFFSSSETAAVCCLPVAVTVTVWKAISMALSVMVLEGSLSVMSMVSTPVKVAAFRSGVSASV